MKLVGDRSQQPVRQRTASSGGLTLALAVLLGACAAQSPPAADAAKPSMETAPAPLSQASNVIYVVPVEGLENPLRLVLADAVAASLRDSERPAILADAVNNQGPSILPVVEQVRERGSVVWVTTRWKLRAPYGTVVAERQREMVIDKTLWERKSVETVNLIIDDAMPAVTAMVKDFVGPPHVAEAVEPAELVGSPKGGMESEPLAESTGTPILGRADRGQGTEPTLPAAVGAPAPPEPAENLVLDLPMVSQTQGEPMPGARPDAAPPQTASRPPMVLAPSKAAEAEMPRTVSDEPEAASPPQAMAGSSTTRETMMPGEPAEPVPLSAPPPPQAISGIAPGPRDTPVRWGKPSFLVRTVRGAPGDGNKALALAIGAALRAKDLTVTEDPRQAGYEVVGKVDVGPPVNGRQRARITWAVNTMGGQEVGKAVQENIVAAGSLDSSWGRVAILVSSAAANGIQQLFDTPRPRYTPVGAVPDFPKIPDLPRVPGRALPPPS